MFVHFSFHPAYRDDNIGREETIAIYMLLPVRILYNLPYCKKNVYKGKVQNLILDSFLFCFFVTRLSARDTSNKETGNR